jgi:hypothetical protein
MRILHRGQRRKSHGSNPSTPPSSCFTSPFSVLPHIPPQSFGHAFCTNGGSDNDVIPFGSGKRFGLVDTGLRRLEGSLAVGGKWEASSAFPHHPWDIFPWSMASVYSVTDISCVVCFGETSSIERSLCLYDSGKGVGGGGGRHFLVFPENFRLFAKQLSE